MTRISDAVSSGLKVGREIRGVRDQRAYDEELATIKTPAQLAQERADASASEANTASLAGELMGPGAGVSQPRTIKAPVKAEPTLLDQVDYLNQRAQLAAKHGRMDADGFAKLHKTIGGMKSEGIMDAFKRFDGGDIAGGLAAYNATGNHRVELVDAKDADAEIGGVKVKTKLVTIKDENGHTETLDTARFLHSMSGLENILKTEQEGMKLHTDRIKANADKTKAEADTVKSGIKPYKVEGSEVATVLGEPAVDKKGRPIMDPMTGRQAVNRNQAKEQAFYKWMADNGITDTNEGLAKYAAMQAQPAAAPRKVPQRPLSEF